MQNTRGSEEAKRWASDRAGEFGEAVKMWRERRKLSAAALARLTEEIGYPITRGTIAKIEGNHRAGKVDLAEVVTLAAALEVAPIELLYPNLADGPVEVLPGEQVSSWKAVERFGGEVGSGVGTLVGLARQRASFLRLMDVDKLPVEDALARANSESAKVWADYIETTRGSVESLQARIREAGGVIDDG